MRVYYPTLAKAVSLALTPAWFCAGVTLSGSIVGAAALAAVGWAAVACFLTREFRAALAAEGEGAGEAPVLPTDAETAIS